MIEVTCQSCGEKVGVQSFLAAAQEPCGRCGRLLMGPLDRGSRTVRPAGFDGKLSPPGVPCQENNSAGLWLGLVAGALAGVAAVVALAFLGPTLPPSYRSAILAALAGVLLAPVIAVAAFFAMLVSPFGVAAVIGDSLWSGLAQALFTRRLRHLIFPALLLFVLPMGACGYGGARMEVVETSLYLSAGLGAMILGGILGAMCGARASKAP